MLPAPVSPKRHQLPHAPVTRAINLHPGIYNAQCHTNNPAPLPVSLLVAVGIGIGISRLVRIHFSTTGGGARQPGFESDFSPELDVRKRRCTSRVVDDNRWRA